MISQDAHQTAHTTSAALIVWLVGWGETNLQDVALDDFRRSAG